MVQRVLHVFRIEQKCFTLVVSLIIVIIVMLVDSHFLRFHHTLVDIHGQQLTRIGTVSYVSLVFLINLHGQTSFILCMIR